MNLMKTENMNMKMNGKANLMIASIRSFCVMASLLAICAFVSGCSESKDDAKKPSKVNARINDKEYNEKLRNMMQENRALVSQQAEYLSQLNDIKNRAKKLLPEGTSEEDVVKYILSNPEKFPAWEVIQGKISTVKKELAEKGANARKVIAERIARENAERSAAKKAVSSKNSKQEKGVERTPAHKIVAERAKRKHSENVAKRAAEKKETK